MPTASERGTSLLRIYLPGDRKQDRYFGNTSYQLFVSRICKFATLDVLVEANKISANGTMFTYVVMDEENTEFNCENNATEL